MANGVYDNEYMRGLAAELAVVFALEQEIRDLREAGDALAEAMPRWSMYPSVEAAPPDAKVRAEALAAWRKLRGQG